ncbi:hypothetical protein [Nocardia jiangxiensis]|uniref:Pirin C-terminal cupin domain-containing protein n=1 Tax=Nocardia jiangxiensis TaxID=282685 RepID=A0ABW6SC98_9NOCA|nr:hypothetical protein [Nocardia jiangxiensis]
MKVVPYDESAYHMDHPMGTVAFNYLLSGDDSETTENFRYVLGRQEGDFHMPRHRHSLEQIRLPIVGDMNLGEQGILHEGEIGYFPEGVYYGPQDDPLGDPKQLQLVLQFGGASGLGMGMPTDAQKADAARGTRRPGEQLMPRPRYADVIKFDPANYNYLPVAGQPGVQRKFFGAFTERALRIEWVKIETGAQWVSAEDSRRFVVVLGGGGVVADMRVGYLAAVQAEVGETLTVTAEQDLELHVVAVPPVLLPEIPQQHDVVISRGAIEFETPRDLRKAEAVAASNAARRG